MTLTFPLPAETFFGALPIKNLAIDMGEAVQLSRLEDGTLLTAERGTRLWSGKVALGKMSRAELAAPRAFLNSLRQTGRSFLAYDTTRPFPLRDPTGALLGAAMPVIASLPADNRSLSLAGLPPGYELSPGDLIGWTYGSNPLRYALHEIVIGDVADGAGLTGPVEVTPFVRPGAFLGASVALIKPAFKAILIPGSIEAGMTGRFYTEGMSFALQQTLR